MADSVAQLEFLGLGFSRRELSAIRRLVESEATEAGFPPERVEDLVFAVNEVATNALRHGGEPARIRIWHEHGRLVCEVSDPGAGLTDPRVGRRKPPIGPDGGFGLWVARQMCESIEFRTDGPGNIVSVEASLAKTA